MGDAWAALEGARWSGGPPGCPRCGAAGRCSLLPGVDGSRRVWRCGACRAQFSVLTGTLLERTRVPLPTLIEFVSSVVAGGASSRELARRHGLTPATARLLRKRLLAADVREGDPPEAALRQLLGLSPSEVARVRRGVPGRRDVTTGPSATYG